MKNYFLILTILASFFLANCAKEEIETIVENPLSATLSESFTAAKTGTFVAMNGYPTKGSTDLGINKANDNVLRLNEDFSTTFATGAVTIYLSKNKELKLSDGTSHVKIAVVNKAGLQYLKVDQKDLTGFNHVVVWCAPAGIQFGGATLQ